jgi:hypothetical protein
MQLTFNNLTLVDYDIMIRGLRLIRRGAYDNYTRCRAGELLEKVLEEKRKLVRKPESVI